MHRGFIFLGAVSAALAVTLGAFGAHVLGPRLSPELLAVYQTGVDYHFVHALGLLLTGIAAAGLGGSLALRLAGWLMLGGTVLFSGSLYLLAVTGLRWLGAITPFGGTAFILAWALLALAAWRHREASAG